MRGERTALARVLRCDREGREGVWPTPRRALEQLRRASPAGLHSSEQKLNAINGFNVLHLRAAYFMENNVAATDMIRGMGLFGHALRPDLKLPMIATRDVGDYAAQRLLNLDFSGKEAREVLGERDLSMAEVTAAIARGIGKPDLHYEQFSYDQVRQVLVQMGFSPKKASVYIEMFEAIDGGLLVAQEPRSMQNKGFELSISLETESRS